MLVLVNTELICGTDAFYAVFVVLVLTTLSAAVSICNSLNTMAKRSCEACSRAQRFFTESDCGSEAGQKFTEIATQHMAVAI